MIERHVVPVRDARRHTIRYGQCWCQPRVEEYENGNTLAIHNSADRREVRELIGQISQFGWIVTTPNHA